MKKIHNHSYTYSSELGCEWLAVVAGVTALAPGIMGGMQSIPLHPFLLSSPWVAAAKAGWLAGVAL